tara:strand:+ start:1668 stop:1904 length:237 start_codon:yes stop_codon:yes gene_type:complete
MEKDLKNMKTKLLSSVAKEGRYVTQIIHFKEGYRKTIHGIDTLSIEQGQFTKFKCKDGRYILINDVNVLMVETFVEEI